MMINYHSESILYEYATLSSIRSLQVSRATMHYYRGELVRIHEYYYKKKQYFSSVLLYQIPVMRELLHFFACMLLFLPLPPQKYASQIQVFVTKYQKPKTSTDISSKPPLSQFFICTLLNGYLSFFFASCRFLQSKNVAFLQCGTLSVYFLRLQQCS